MNFLRSRQDFHVTEILNAIIWMFTIPYFRPFPHKIHSMIGGRHQKSLEFSPLFNAWNKLAYIQVGDNNGHDDSDMSEQIR